MKKKSHSLQFIFAFSIMLLFFSKDSLSQAITLVKKDSVITDTTFIANGPIPHDTTVTGNNSFQHDTTSGANSSFTQDGTQVENGYYIVYANELILRLYLTNKFAPFTISSSNKEDLNYRSNSKLGLGAGFTYKALTLNLAYGFDFLNPDKGRGITKGLDLQVHLYPKKWSIDLVGAFLKGYYLDPADNNGLGLTDYYHRPDLQRNIMGISVYRVANANKFSYRAAFNQKDWQIKSAGSLLYGAGSYYGIVKGDSALVPSHAGSNYLQAGISKINFLSIGPGIGYAYTLVLGRHFFITGSAIVNINLNISAEKNGGNTNSKVEMLPGGNYKAAVGYNGSSWSITAALLGNAMYAASAVSQKEYFLPTGNVNFVVAKKFGTKRK